MPMNYLKIDKCNMNNGSGLRVVVWLSGCNHHCENCFNPETWNQNNGDKFANTELNIILETLAQDWCSGITLTGGDPFFPANMQDTINLCQTIKQQFPNKTIWVYTGYNFEQLDTLSLTNIDVLVDGEYIDKLNSPDKHWAGSSNQRIINIPQSLATNSIVLL